MLQSINVIKLFGIFDYKITMKPDGVTILTGPNGFGKSTLLKCIDAMYRGDILFFSRLDFEEIEFVSDSIHTSFKIRKNECNCFSCIETKRSWYSFFSNDFYTANTKAKNAIAKVIYGFAAQGHVVVVGRAAESIVKDITKSLRLKIEAPLDYRARVVSELENMSVSDAKKKCLEMDKKRQQFRRYFENERPDIDFFDLSFNASTLSDDEIIEMILVVAETRGFI